MLKYASEDGPEFLALWIEKKKKNDKLGFYNWTL